MRANECLWVLGVSAESLLDISSPPVNILLLYNSMKHKFIWSVNLAINSECHHWCRYCVNCRGRNWCVVEGKEFNLNFDNFKTWMMQWTVNPMSHGHGTVGKKLAVSQFACLQLLIQCFIFWQTPHSVHEPAWLQDIWVEQEVATQSWGRSTSLYLCIIFSCLSLFSFVPVMHVFVKL